MDTTSALARFEAALTDQLVLTGEPAVESAARSLQAALAPAARQMALELAEQAATEVDAQLPDYDVRVVLVAGEPALAAQPSEPARRQPEDEESYEARVTLRLPPSLKHLVEEAAQTAGDSVNSWIVDALSGAATRVRNRPGRRVRGTVQT